MKVKNTNKSKKQIKYKKRKTLKQKGSGGNTSKTKLDKEENVNLMLPTQNPNSAFYNPTPIKIRSPPRVHKMQRRGTNDSLTEIQPISSMEEKRLRDMSRVTMDHNRTRKIPEFKRFSVVPAQDYDPYRPASVPIMRTNSFEPIKPLRNRSLSDMENAIPRFRKVNSFNKYLNEYMRGEEDPPYFGGKKCKHKNNKTCKRCKKK